MRSRRLELTRTKRHKWHDQAPGMPQHPPQWQGPQVPPPPQPSQGFNMRLPHDDVEPNANSIFRARGMQQAFVAGGQDILICFKIDRKFVDLKKFSGIGPDWKDWKKKVVGHCAGSTGNWRRIFKAIGVLSTDDAVASRERADWPGIHGLGLV